MAKKCKCEGNSAFATTFHEFWCPANPIPPKAANPIKEIQERFSGRVHESDKHDHPEGVLAERDRKLGGRNTSYLAVPPKAGEPCKECRGRGLIWSSEALLDGSPVAKCPNGCPEGKYIVVPESPTPKAREPLVTWANVPADAKTRYCNYHGLVDKEHDHAPASGAPKVCDTCERPFYIQGKEGLQFNFCMGHIPAPASGDEGRRGNAQELEWARVFLEDQARVGDTYVNPVEALASLLHSVAWRVRSDLKARVGAETRCVPSQVGYRIEGKPNPQGTYQLNECAFDKRIWHIYEQPPICDRDKSAAFDAETK